jgi:hypothetical protein
VLKKAAVEIDMLSTKISEMAPVLARTKAEIAEKLEIVTKEKAEADIERAKV